MRYWHILFIFCCLYLGGCSFLPHGMKNQSVPRVVTPIEDQPCVEAWVGDKVVHLAVDTGAADKSYLFAGNVENLGGRVRGKFPQQTSSVKVVMTEDDLEDSSPQSVTEASSFSFSGLMGWSKIKNYVWHIDAPQGRHSFDDSIPLWVRAWNSFSFDRNQDFPCWRDEYGQSVVLDTGAPQAIYLNEEQWKTWKEENPYAFVTLYSGYSPAAGGAYVRECARADVFHLGDVSFYHVIVCESFVDKKLVGRNIDIMLGWGALKNKETWIDGPRGKIYFSNKEFISEGRNEAFLNLVGAEFIPHYRSSGRVDYYKAQVLKGSVAWKSGLRSGDVLVSINKIRFPSSEVLSYLTSSEGAQVRVVVRRQGQERIVKWVVPTEEEVQPEIPDEEIIEPESETEKGENEVLTSDENNS